MAKRALTTKGVEALKSHPEKRLEKPDAALPGLYLVVQPSGVKSWALRYRFAGKPAKLTLGRWPLVGLAEARAAATEALDKLAQGRNPAAEQRAAKAARLEAQLSERNKIKTLVEQFDREHLSTIESGRAARATGPICATRMGRARRPFHHPARRARPSRSHQGRRAGGDRKPRAQPPRDVLQLVRCAGHSNRLACAGGEARRQGAEPRAGAVRR
jgi:hypothetical protein